MTTPKPVPKEIEAPEDELSDEEFMRLHGIKPLTPEEEAAEDAWIKRNKDALNASIREAREQFALGEYYTLEEVEAHLDADRLERLKKK